MGQPGAPEKDSLPVPAWHRAELQKRQVEIDEGPGEAIPWDELKRQLLRGRI